MHLTNNNKMMDMHSNSYALYRQQVRSVSITFEQPIYAWGKVTKHYMHILIHGNKLEQ